MNFASTLGDGGLPGIAIDTRSAPGDGQKTALVIGSPEFQRK
jgi:hypothetical protein